jgi:hypothetical protein
MSKFTLIYTGPESRRGRELCGMLTSHPDAKFVEKEPGIFEVTAETGFDQSIGAEEPWRADCVEPRPRRQ